MPGFLRLDLTGVAIVRVSDTCDECVSRRPWLPDDRVEREPIEVIMAPGSGADFDRFE
jgi:hypothetical protein